MIEYRRFTHIEYEGKSVFRGSHVHSEDVINNATDGLIHAFDSGWHTLGEIIRWCKDDSILPGENWPTDPVMVAEYLAVLAAEGAVEVRVTAVVHGKSIQQFVVEQTFSSEVTDA